MFGLKDRALLDYEQFAIQQRCMDYRFENVLFCNVSHQSKLQLKKYRVHVKLL